MMGDYINLNNKINPLIRDNIIVTTVAVFIMDGIQCKRAKVVDRIFGVVRSIKSMLPIYPSELE